MLVASTHLINSNGREQGVGLIELLVSLIIFTVCIVSLTKMQFNSSMGSVDNHQRSVALWAARGLVDRISANYSQNSIREYQSVLSDFAGCDSSTPKRCETTSSTTQAQSCDASELAEYDVWSTVCDTNNGLDVSLINYSFDLICAGICTTDSNIQLDVSWVSRVSDSDARLNTTTSIAGADEVASNLDFITLQFRP